MRNVDVLLVDDIQFLSKTVATQEEFFHTFNHLHTGGKQIILSSDRPPKDIPTIEERLRSRFEWGLTDTRSRVPDFETRVAILQKKCVEEEIDRPEEVLEYIAERVESNIRELEGMLVRVNAQAQLMGKPITLEMTRETLAALLSSREPRKITPDSIIQTVSSHYSVSGEDVTGKRRSRDIALPRQVSMYLIRELTPLSTTAIGRVFSGRDHSTVMHSCDKVAEMMRKDIAFRKTVEELRQFVTTANPLWKSPGFPHTPSTAPVEGKSPAAVSVSTLFHIFPRPTAPTVLYKYNHHRRNTPCALFAIPRPERGPSDRLPRHVNAHRQPHPRRRAAGGAHGAASHHRLG